jgi:adenylate kinase
MAKKKKAAKKKAAKKAVKKAAPKKKAAKKKVSKAMKKPIRTAARSVAEPPPPTGTIDNNRN